MEMLYAPWRSEYTNNTQEGKNEGAGKETCHSALSLPATKILNMELLSVLLIP
jgi:hypothetical protein